MICSGYKAFFDSFPTTAVPFTTNEPQSYVLGGRNHPLHSNSWFLILADSPYFCSSSEIQQQASASFPWFLIFLPSGTMHLRLHDTMQKSGLPKLEVCFSAKQFRLLPLDGSSLYRQIWARPHTSPRRSAVHSYHSSAATSRYEYQNFLPVFIKSHCVHSQMIIRMRNGFASRALFSFMYWPSPLQKRELPDTIVSGSSLFSAVSGSHTPEGATSPLRQQLFRRVPGQRMAENQQYDPVALSTDEAKGGFSPLSLHCPAEERGIRYFIDPPADALIGGPTVGLPAHLASPGASPASALCRRISL